MGSGGYYSAEYLRPHRDSLKARAIIWPAIISKEYE